MKFYFWIAFYSDGRMRLFNTKHEPKPVNKIGKAHLIEVKKYTQTYQIKNKKFYEVISLNFMGGELMKKI